MRSPDRKPVSENVQDSGGDVLVNTGSAPAAQQETDPRFGHDFADVSIHAGDAAAGRFLVEDDAQPASGQMRKSEFLTELQGAVCAAADAELAAAGRSTEGCPYLDQAFPRYRAMPAANVERFLQRYVDTAGATGAHDYIPLVTRRVSEGVARWVATGDTTGVPAEVAGEAKEAGGQRPQFKRHGNATATDAETAAASRLGRGAPLDGFVRGRMEHAFGFDFSSVRIHADTRAATASSSLGARAFTIGNDVAFGGGEFRPNTPEGDALIAHELAHVVQQSGGVQTKGSGADALDEDADRSAVSAVVAIWTGARRVAAEAMPRLRSGLGLQRCTKTPERKTAELLASFAGKFPVAASLTSADKGAMDLVREAAAADVEFGGYSEEGPFPKAWSYTSGRTVYVTKTRVDPVLAMNSFLFELGNAIRNPQFKQARADATEAKIDPKTYARRAVELEVESMLRLGEIWIEMRKKDADFTKYDEAYYLDVYQQYKDGKKTKEEIIDEVLQMNSGLDPSKTYEEFYMDQAMKMSGG